MPDSVRHDWYQTETHVVVNVLVKNVRKEDVNVKCTEDNLEVSFVTADGQSQTFSANLLHKVNPDSIVHRTLQTKIEVKLLKREDLRWPTLERPMAAEAAASRVQGGDGPPKYPSSSSRARDWGAVETEIAKEEEGEKPEGEAALNSLFQKIYSQGTDEVKKAMNKSFSESGGTVLSTNWNEVERDKIDVKAPDGMEWKHWDS